MLRVSENRRFLVQADGRPFFYLGDTAWELFHRCTLAEADRYLRDRAAIGFTVVQAVALAELGGLTEPNPNGDLPLFDNDPARPNDAYFRHVDAIIARADELGLHVGLLPTWGDKWNQKWGQGPEIFTPENARVYGEWLGRRYRDAPIIWILGGDRPIETENHRGIIEAMARGLRGGDEGRHLIAFHPKGSETSARYFHETDWLDFNMWQSGHNRNRDNWACIAADYALSPPKPCMDAEPGYEDHPDSFDLNKGYLDDYDNRKAAYWALFAGAHGHTYGCHPVWQMLQSDRKAISFARRPWTEALHLPGSGQMRHVRSLLESRPFLTRLPDQALVASEEGVGTDHVQATRDQSGSYALVYVPSGKPITVDLTRLSGETLKAHWYDPRWGVARPMEDVARSGAHEFTPPSGGPDWVLCLDDAAKGYPQPGWENLAAAEREGA